MTSTYVRILGDGRVYQGAAIVTGIAVVPDADGDLAVAYDGLDADSGEKVLEIKSSTQTTQVVVLGDGVRFNRGIYIDATDSAVETTVFFQPLEL